MTFDSSFNRENIIELFPNLKDDKEFKITSPENPNYNCIAWAGIRDNIWWEPASTVPYKNLDGVTVDWPFGAIKDDTILGLIDLFSKQGYIECENSEHEKGFRKIALYEGPDKKYTHATWQRRSGLWSSKLGRSYDISHGTPFTIEGESYGKAVFFMKKKL